MASGTFYPAVSGDDGFIQQTQPLNFTADWITVGDIGGYNYLSFVRFANVAIPQGATITEAFIRVTAYVDKSDVVVRTNIYFNDSDDAIAPTNTTEYAALVDTTAFTVWDDIAAWTDGTTYDFQPITRPFIHSIWYDRTIISDNNNKRRRSRLCL